MGHEGSPESVVAELLDRHGRTYADELQLDPSKPAGLFGLLLFAMLASARIRAVLAVAGTRALLDAGWTTAAKLAATSWDERARLLNSSGYARYDERTATMLGEAAQLVLDRYDGDLRQLRRAAEQDPARERELLQEFKGIGPTGADVFLREVQGEWPELAPYVDRRARGVAEELGLPAGPEELARLVDGPDLPRLVAALVRSALEHDADEIAEAGGASVSRGA